MLKEKELERRDVKKERKGKMKKGKERGKNDKVTK